MFKFLGKKLSELFKGKINEDVLEELEEIFYEADLGAVKSQELAEKVKTLFKKNSQLTASEILSEIKKELIDELQKVPLRASLTSKPYIILIVGVNGNGKTTTVAKLAHHYKKEGKKVLIGAADTFRAAATEQLEKWAEKTHVELVKGKQGSDAASVVFDAIEAAKARNVDVVLLDTAGRLHTKTDLMKELEKIYRVSGKAYPGAPHETLLILDATMGQNALEQAKTFHQFTPLSGLILTKMDGSAKGGSVISIQQSLKLPIKYLGTGEKMEDLHAFNAKEFVDSLLDLG